MIVVIRYGSDLRGLYDRQIIIEDLEKTELRNWLGFFILLAPWSMGMMRDCLSREPGSSLGGAAKQGERPLATPNGGVRIDVL